jgi:hypothetical protein
MKLTLDLASLSADMLTVIIGQSIVNYRHLPVLYSGLLAALEREQRRRQKNSDQCIELEIDLAGDELDRGIAEMLKRRDAFESLPNKPGRAGRELFQRIAAMLMEKRRTMKALVPSSLVQQSQA